MDKNKTSYKILTRLNDGQYHSGEHLGQDLNISRTAIWKGVKQLEALGLAIKSTVGKGYCLEQPIELLDQKKIEAQLSTNSRPHLDRLILLDQTNSTNDYLLEMANTQNTQKIACFAEQQIAGKSRRQRGWVSPFGTNIYHSVLWHFNKDPAELVGLSLVIAVALANALKRYGVPHEAIMLKWPNDVLWQQKKLAGILLEMLAQSHDSTAIVIGVGLNTQMSSDQPRTIDQPWCDLTQILQKKIERNRMAGILLDEIIQSILQFEKQGLGYFLEQWRQYDKMSGSKVRVHTANKTIDGVMQGISERGELIIKNNHKEQRFICGEVGLRQQLVSS